MTGLRYRMISFVGVELADQDLAVPRRLARGDWFQVVAVVAGVAAAALVFGCLALCAGLFAVAFVTPPAAGVPHGCTQSLYHRVIWYTVLHGLDDHSLPGVAMG